MPGDNCCSKSSLFILPKHWLDLEERSSAPQFLQLCCSAASVSLSGAGLLSQFHKTLTIQILLSHFFCSSNGIFPVQYYRDKNAFFIYSNIFFYIYIIYTYISISFNDWGDILWICWGHLKRSWTPVFRKLKWTLSQFFWWSTTKFSPTKRHSNWH